MAARRGHSDQTGGEGQQQSVAGPVQRQRQELTSLGRVLATPGDSEMHECEDGRQRVRSQQREVKSICDRVKGLICWYFKKRQPCAPTLIRMVTTAAEFYLGLCRHRARAV